MTLKGLNSPQSGAVFATGSEAEVRTMPIYEFRCEACAHVFEHLVLSQGDRIEIKCPHCGGEEITRVLSSCAAKVNGSGSSPQGGQPGYESHTCPGSGSCGTITLPGGD